MSALWDKTSHLFVLYLVAIKIPKYVVARGIPKFNGVSDLIQHIHMHKTYFLGRTYDNNHITLLFPSTFLEVVSSWFFSLTLTHVTFWADLKLSFIQRRMGDQQLLMRVVAMNNRNYEPVEYLTDFYGRFHKSVNEINKYVGEGEICCVSYSSVDPLN